MNKNNQSAESFITFHNYLKKEGVLNETMFETNEWITFIDTVLAEAPDLESIMNENTIAIINSLFEEITSIQEFIGNFLFECFDKTNTDKLLEKNLQNNKF